MLLPTVRRPLTIGFLHVIKLPDAELDPALRRYHHLANHSARSQQTDMLNLPLFIISDKYSAIRSRTKGHRFQNNFTLGGEGIEKSDFRSGTRKRKVTNETQTLCLLAVRPKTRQI